MSKIARGLRYSAEHEWLRTGGDAPATVGITSVAADALGDVVFLDLPAVGSAVIAGDTCGEVESTKSVSDLYSPVSGEVTEVNEDAMDSPEVVNTDPYGAGWLFKVSVSKEGPLMSAEEYADANGGEL